MIGHQDSSSRSQPTRRVIMSSMRRARARASASADCGVLGDERRFAGGAHAVRLGPAQEVAPASSVRSKLPSAGGRSRKSNGKKPLARWRRSIRLHRCRRVRQAAAAARHHGRDFQERATARAGRRVGSGDKGSRALRARAGPPPAQSLGPRDRSPERQSRSARTAPTAER